MTVEEFIEQIANLENKDNTLNCSQYTINITEYNEALMQEIIFEIDNIEINHKTKQIFFNY